MPKGVNRTVFLLGIVSLLNDLSSEMILPILPLFISDIGGGAIAIGLMGGIADAIASLLKVFSGHWSDRFGKKKPFVVGGYLASAASKLLYAFSQSWPIVLALRVADRVGKGIRSAPRDALIAETTPQEHRGAAYGFHRAMDSFGAIAGTFAVIILFWFLSFGFRDIFIVAGVIGFFSLIPFIFMKEKKAAGTGKTLIMSISELETEFKKFLVVAGIFYLANFSYMFFILRTQIELAVELGNPMDSILIVLLLYAWFNVVYTLFAYPAGRLSDKIGRKKTIAIAYALFAISCLGFAFFSNLMIFVILFAIYGLFYAFLEGNERAFAADLSKIDTKGSTLGIFHTIIGLAALPASLIAGAAWELISPETAFLIAFFLSTLALVGLIFWVKK